MKIFITALLLFLAGGIAFANNGFQIIPESKNPEAGKAAVSGLLEVGTGDFWAKYNQEAEKNKNDLGQQIQTGIFSWNSILDIGVYILRFIMQIALVIGAAMIIKSGYSYAMVAMGAEDKEESVSKPIKNALFGLFIISISYTIIKLLQMAFLE